MQAIITFMCGYEGNTGAYSLRLQRPHHQLLSTNLKATMNIQLLPLGQLTGRTKLSDLSLHNSADIDFLVLNHR